MTRTFTIDEDRAQRIIAAGEAAEAANHELADAESAARQALARVKLLRNRAREVGPYSFSPVNMSDGERRQMPNPKQYDAEIERLERAYERAAQRRAEAAARRQHDVRLASRVSDYLGERRGPGVLMLQGA